MCTPASILLLLLIVHVHAKEEPGGCWKRKAPAHGVMKVILQRVRGVMVQYSCHHGYRRVGSLYSVCIDGTWTTPLPSCVGKSVGEMNDVAIANQDEGVLLSLEELPSTQRSAAKGTSKLKTIRKKKKKRKRKGKSKQLEPIISPGGNLTTQMDMSCLISKEEGIPKFVRPPQIPNSIGPKIVRRKLEAHKYLVAIYRCTPGYKLYNSRTRWLGCLHGKWVGQLPICLQRKKNVDCSKSGCEHDCREVAGQAKCFCFRGFRPVGKQCLDVNECKIGNGVCQKTCHNTPGSFVCGCPPGFRLAADMSSCIDTNECLARNGHGPCQGECTNVDGSYQCSCDSTPGTRLADDGISCQDVDECHDTEYQLGCSHTCINTVGSAFCTCPPGYQLMEDWRQCQDIDECKLGISNCSHECRNTEGSFTCSCPVGFVTGDDGRTCVDVDECSEFDASEACSHACVNSLGSYHCLCPDGLELSAADQRTCRQKGNACQEKNCSHDCIIIDGEAECICDDGYVLEKDSSCVDNDECVDSYCSHDCVNEEGSFYCTCPKGMVLLADKRTCVESDCDFKICPQGCINNHPIKCACPEGFVENNTKCEDIDECSLEIDTCSHLCQNLNGSFECYCPEGFVLDEDQETCVDINECEDSPCQGHMCVNTEGSFFCDCAPGFNFNKVTKTCEDINECNIVVDEGSNICSHFCRNTLGSFVCDCPEGFSLGDDLKNCYDIDECQETNDISRKCSHQCVNEISGYHCECPEGFALSQDNHLCSKLSPCSSNNGGCSDICIDDNGDSFCECSEWKVLSSDNVTCLSPCLFDNHGCSQLCDEFNGTCSCDVGFKINDDLKTCDEIDPCSNFSDSCKGASNRIQILEENGSVSFPDKGIPGEELGEEDYGNPQSENKIEINQMQTLFETEKIRKDDHTHLANPCERLLTADQALSIECTSEAEMYRECYFSCKAGFTLEGSSVRRCLRNGSWSGQGTSCKAQVLPFIQCARLIRLSLPKGKSGMDVRIPQPKTNVDWLKDVVSVPEWGKQLQAFLSVGTTSIQFIARSSSSNTTSKCNVSIIIKDTEKPTINGCPKDIDITLRNQMEKTTVLWDPPTFSDNVQIAHVFQSKRPGVELTRGVHMVNYIVADSSGNIATCQFTVRISGVDDTENNF